MQALPTQDGYWYLFNSNDFDQPSQSQRFVVLDRPVQLDAWGLEAGEFLCLYRTLDLECCEGISSAKPYLDACKNPVCLSCECTMVTAADPGPYILVKSGDIVGTPTVTGRYIAK